MKNSIVIGGGSAGMMAAVIAARRGNRVKLYEQNEKLGKKLFITGKGRCNVTNNTDCEDLLSNVISNPKFLYSAFYDFDGNHQFTDEDGLGFTLYFGDEIACIEAQDKSTRVFDLRENAGSGTYWCAYQ